MENITEKKWFVYVKDHHEGPHSAFEIQHKLNQGLVESEGFVWAEGMDDWQRMTDVAVFKTLLKDRPLGLSPEAEARLNENVESGPEKSNQVLSDSAMPGESQDLSAPRKSFKSFLGRFRGGFTLGVLLAIAMGYRLGYFDPILDLPAVQSTSDSLGSWSRPYLLKVSEHLPLLERWISPIPRLDDVAPEDFEELKQAARAKLQKQGPQFAIALSRGHPGSPFFYMASNVGEGAKFRVWIVGVPDTLLNQLSYVSQAEGVISQKFGKTEVVRYADGRVIPRGEYRVYLTAAEGQPAGIQPFIDSALSSHSEYPSGIPKNVKILSVKSYFLAGNRDTSYLDRLRDFHEKLRARALGEIIETRQFMLTLASQLDSTQEKFARLGKSKPSPQQRKMWNNFHKEWTQLQSELEQIFQKWSPEAIKNEYFYGVLYQQVQELGHSVSQVHDLQQGYFTGVHDLRESLARVKSEADSTTRLLESLRVKIEHAEKLPPTPSGMPQREGL